jgi:hypothetical protein
MLPPWAAHKSEASVPPRSTCTVAAHRLCGGVGNNDMHAPRIEDAPRIEKPHEAPPPLLASRHTTVLTPADHEPFLRAPDESEPTRFKQALQRRARAEIDERFVATYTPADFERCCLRHGMKDIRGFAGLCTVERIVRLSTLLGRTISDLAMREMLLLAMRTEVGGFEAIARMEDALARAIEGEL